MSDNNDSTLSSSPGSVEEAVEHFLADTEGAVDVTPEAELRHQAHALTLGVAYAWAARDERAQEALLDELVAMPHGLGVTFAVELLTSIRLYGLRPGSLRPSTDVGTRWLPTERPGARPEAGSDHAYSDVGECWDALTPEQREQVEIITDLWSGLGSWDVERLTLARARMARLQRPQLREVLRIMAFDAYQVMEDVAEWQGVGAETVEDFRLKHPQDYEVAGPSASQRG